MTRRRPGPGRKLLALTFLAGGCSGGGSTDAGTDAGCMTPDVNDAGMRCGCLVSYDSMGNPYRMLYCDPDIGNPCPLECFNPREPDGGRQYTDAGPVCLC